MMSILKVDTEIITSITSCPVGRAVILVIMYIEIFKSDVVVFIGRKSCDTSDHVYGDLQIGRCCFYW